MELRQLRYAVAVADRLSFTRAATDEVVAQSALSHQIGKLEQELGVRLFERTTRSVSITAAGDTLLPLIRHILAGTDQLTAEARSIRGVLQGRITVGLMEVPPGVLDLAELVATFHRGYPGVDIAVRSAAGEQLVQGVRDRELDVALVGLTEIEASDRLQTMSLLVEPLVAVLPEGHELAARESVTVGELARFPFIDVPRGYGVRAETDRGFKPSERRVGFEVTRVPLMAEFVRHGLGVAVLPESMGRFQARSGGLVLARISDAQLQRQVQLVFPTAPGLSAVGRAFVATVEQMLDRPATLETASPAPGPR